MHRGYIYHSINNVSNTVLSLTVYLSHGDWGLELFREKGAIRRILVVIIVGVFNVNHLQINCKEELLH